MPTLSSPPAPEVVITTTHCVSKVGVLALFGSECSKRATPGNNFLLKRIIKIDTPLVGSRCWQAFECCEDRGQGCHSTPASSRVVGCRGEHKYNGRPSCRVRSDSRLAPSQWETALLCNDVSHWLGANLESSLVVEEPVDATKACVWEGISECDEFSEMMICNFFFLAD